ncbi:MAG: cupin domain-containing protein [Smithellaceae bacterium]|nr:cupin domain-containing protein [Smithellaceae bacterium]
MTFWNLESIQLEPFRPGITSRAEIGDNLIMVCMEIGPDKEDPGHRHPFDQCGMILAGRLEMLIGEERRIMEAGEAYFIPAGLHHGWKTFAEPVRLFDISPKQPPPGA